MTDTESPIGERVAAVETDIKHILDGIVRIEGSVARIENVVIKEKTEKLDSDIARIENVVIKDAVSRLETGIARVDRRLTETNERLEAGIAETRAELKSDIARVEDSLGETRAELKSDIARVEGRITEMKDDLQQTLLAAMSENRKAIYVLCGTVIAGIVAALLKGSFF